MLQFRGDQLGQGVRRRARAVQEPIAGRAYGAGNLDLAAYGAFDVSRLDAHARCRDCAEGDVACDGSGVRNRNAGAVIAGDVDGAGFDEVAGQTGLDRDARRIVTLNGDGPGVADVADECARRDDADAKAAGSLRPGFLVDAVHWLCAHGEGLAGFP